MAACSGFSPRFCRGMVKWGDTLGESQSASGMTRIFLAIIHQTPLLRLSANGNLRRGGGMKFSISATASSVLAKDVTARLDYRLALWTQPALRRLPRQPMKRFFVLRFALLCLLLGCASSRAPAQVYPSPATNAATLARYDTNRNRRIDADEIRAQEADRQRGIESGAVRPDEPSCCRPSKSSPTRGYYASNTMSGTRFNSKLEDLASSITVMTKEQMSDFAMLDINDVFLYTANTEGTGNYTDFEMIGTATCQDNVSLNPTGANRIRGIGSANVSLGNFETLRPRAARSARHRCASKSAAGPTRTSSASATPPARSTWCRASANLRRNRPARRSRRQLRRLPHQPRREPRADARTSLPSGSARLVPARRLRPQAVRRRNGALQRHGAVTSRSRRTTITASFQCIYRMNGNRPNALPPLDGISDWRRITGGATSIP